MSKKKKKVLSGRIDAFRHFEAEGIRERREQRSPIYRPESAVAPIYTRQQREHVVSKLRAVLADFQFSPFEHEADCRHGLRQSLCLDGFNWTRSDGEAAALVGEGLSALGANRPSWAEGQPEYTVGRESCLNCHGPMDEEAIAHGDRYCSPECAKAYLHKREVPAEAKRTQAVYSAYRVVQVANREKRICGCCGKAYHPRSNGAALDRQQYCSVACANLGRRSDDLEVTCANPKCGKHFRVHARQFVSRVRYCSKACRAACGVTVRFDKRCLICGKGYDAKSSRSEVCSARCKSILHRNVKANLPPSDRRGRPIFNAVTFDFFVMRMPLRASTSNLVASVTNW